MNISTQIIDVLEYIGGKFGIAIDWSQENVMPYIQSLCEKILQYEVYTSIFWIIMMGAVVVVSAIIAISTYPAAKKMDWDFNYAIPWVSGSSIVVLLVFGVAFIIVAGYQVYDIITAYCIPEITIMKFFESVITKLNA